MIRVAKEEEENESNNSVSGVETSDKKNATSCSSGSGEAEEEEEAGLACLELDAWIGDGDSMDCMMLLPEMPLDGEDSPSPDTSMHHSSASQDECNNPEDIFCRSSSGSSTTNQSNQEALELILPDDFFPNKQQAEQVHQQGPVTSSAQRPRCLDLKKIIVKKPVMDKAVERLGGGRRGALRLWNIIQVWLRCQEQGSAAAADSLNGLMQPFGSSNATLGGSDFLNFPIVDHQVFSSSIHPDQLQHNAQFGCFADTGLVPAPPPPQMGGGSPFYSDLAGADGVVPAAPVSFSSAATTRAARKSRMARQRRQRGNGNHQLHSSLACSQVSSPVPAPAPAPLPSPPVWSSNNNSVFMRSSIHAAEHHHHHHPREQFISSRIDKGVNCERNASFLLQKELKPSDVGNLGRIVLPKKEAEVHLPYLSLREGISLAMEDMETGRTWHFRYRFWPNNKSRMYLLEGTGEFIKSHQLKEGDLLQIYQDCKSGKHMIYGKKKQMKLEDDCLSGVSTISEDRGALVERKEDSCTEMETFQSMDVGDEFIDEILGFVDAEEPSSPESCKEDS